MRCRRRCGTVGSKSGLGIESRRYSRATASVRTSDLPEAVGSSLASMTAGHLAGADGPSQTRVATLSRKKDTRYFELPATIRHLGGTVAAEMARDPACWVSSDARVVTKYGER